MLLRTATRALSRDGSKARLSIFVFHRVLQSPDPLLPTEPDAEGFSRIVRWIAAQFVVLPLDVALDRLFRGVLEPRAAAITFDDGYRDNFDVAAPILRAHGLSAAFFVATGFLGSGVMFNDRVVDLVRLGSGSIDASAIGLGRIQFRGSSDRTRAVESILQKIKGLPIDDRLMAVRELELCAGVPAARRRTMMTAEEVAGLHKQGMLVGGHTRNHPILSKVGDAIAEREIQDGFDDLVSVIGARPTVFAYPNGRPRVDFDSRHAEMAKRVGFEYSVTTGSGAATPLTDRYWIPRFTPWDKTPLRFGLRMLSNLMVPAK